jgi:hypothetical protein
MIWLCFKASVACVYTKVAALKRIKWKYLFAFLFGSGGMACCSMAMNIWMEMMIPLLFSLVDAGRWYKICEDGSVEEAWCDGYRSMIRG